MNESTEIIRLEIDGRWSVSEMSRSLAHLEDLYNLRLILETMQDEWRDWEKFNMEFMHFPPFRKSFKRRMMSPFPFVYPFLQTPVIPLAPDELSKLSRMVFPNEQFEVRKIEYGSPGFKDLAGVGEITGHLKDFLVVLLDRWLNRKQRKLQDDEREIRNEGLRIENARQFVQLAKDAGYSEQDLRGLIRFVDDRQETFIHLIENSKIRKVYLLSEEKESQG
jgi:hypothetical protein